MSEFFEKKLTGNIIKEKRLELGLTQANFAKKINVTISAVSKWETGRGMPDITLLYIIARELGITIDYLLSGDEPPSIDNAIKAYKKNLLKRIIKSVSVFILAGIFVLSAILSIYYNKEMLFYGGNSDRNCYNFAKDYLAAYNGSNEDFAKYLGLSGDEVDLFLMTKFVERKNNNGKLRYLKVNEQGDRRGKLNFLFCYESGVTIGNEDSADFIKTNKSWSYKYVFPKVSPSSNCYNSIINIETRTITIPLEREGYLQPKDLKFWGIDYKSVVLYDELDIINYQIFPKNFIKAFENDDNINNGHYFLYSELYALLTIESQNVWFRLTNKSTTS